MAKPSQAARTMFGPRRGAKGRKKGESVSSSPPSHSAVKLALSADSCPNGCGKLDAAGKCPSCGFTYEVCSHAPVPEWML